MNGYRQRNMPQIQGGGGFYNPMMQRPDWGAGASRIATILEQIQQRKKTEKKQKVEEGLAERQMKAEEKRAEAYRKTTELQSRRFEESIKTKPLPERVPPELEQYLLSNFGQEWKTNVTRGQFDYYRDMWADEKLRKEQTEGKVNPKIAKQFDFVNTTMNGYIREIQGIQEFLSDPYKTAELSVNERGQMQTQLENIQGALGRLREFQSHLYMHDTPLTTTQLKELGKFNTHRTRVKESGIFWERTGKPRLTDRNTVEFQGKEYPLNPDGTVTINGQVYQIKKKS